MKHVLGAGSLSSQLDPLTGSPDSCPTAPISPFLLFLFSAQELLLASAFSGGLNWVWGGPWWDRCAAASRGGLESGWSPPWAVVFPDVLSAGHQAKVSFPPLHPDYPGTEVIFSYLQFTMGSRGLQRVRHDWAPEDQQQQGSPWVGVSGHRRGGSSSLFSAGRGAVQWWIRAEEPCRWWAAHPPNHKAFVSVYPVSIPRDFPGSPVFKTRGF